jgi:hypothetical protein
MSRRRRNRDPRPKLLKAAEARELVARRDYPDPLPHWTVPPRAARPQEMAEADIGAELMQYSGLRRLLAYHVPNEGLPGGLQASLIRQGLVPGQPDYTFPVPVQYDGAWRTFHLEIKSFDDWKMSRVQGDRIMALRRAGQIAEVTWGLDWPIELIDFFYGFK